MVVISAASPEQRIVLLLPTELGHDMAPTVDWVKFLIVIVVVEFNPHEKTTRVYVLMPEKPEAVITGLGSQLFG
jgi:hypothetical protein